MYQNLRQKAGKDQIQLAQKNRVPHDCKRPVSVAHNRTCPVCHLPISQLFHHNLLNATVVNYMNLRYLFQSFLCT